jgi:hypothetical protein
MHGFRVGGHGYAGLFMRDGFYSVHSGWRICAVKLYLRTRERETYLYVKPVSTVWGWKGLLFLSLAIRVGLRVLCFRVSLFPLWLSILVSLCVWLSLSFSISIAGREIACVRAEPVYPIASDRGKGRTFLTGESVPGGYLRRRGRETFWGFRSGWKGLLFPSLAIRVGLHDDPLCPMVISVGFGFFSLYTTGGLSLASSASLW